tara:strand:+ start:9416 stop:9616 length:201 start_codon:yes stop_codon:yes gene_type:complete
MERAEELQETIRILKKHLNIPIFGSAEDEVVFIKAFLAKQEYLIEKEKNHPLRISLKDFEESLINL